jgi:hypothetical protein
VLYLALELILFKEVDMATTAPRTWKATTAGILNIVSGSFNGLLAIMIVIAVILYFAAGGLAAMIMDMIPPADVPFVMPLIVPMMAGALVVSVAAAVFPIMGGVYALQRRKWGWALAGSIIAIFSRLSLLGLLATIFVALARDEFE